MKLQVSRDNVPGLRWPVDTRRPSAVLWKTDSGSGATGAGTQKRQQRSSGKASIWDGGSSRPGEEFAVVCGFSVALGPLLLERTHDLGYGRKLFRTVTSLPLIHVTCMLLVYWQNEVSPFDAHDRFFRMVANPETGTISKVQFSTIKCSAG